MKTQDFLDRTKQKLGIESDYALAKELGISREYLSQFRVGKRAISDEVALKVAKILGISPVQILAVAQAERAKNPEIQAAWNGLLEKISMGFNVLTLGANPRRIRLPAR